MSARHRYHAILRAIQYHINVMCPVNAEIPYYSALTAAEHGSNALLSARRSMINVMPYALQQSIYKAGAGDVVGSDEPVVMLDEFVPWMVAILESDPKKYYTKWGLVLRGKEDLYTGLEFDPNLFYQKKRYDYRKEAKKSGKLDINQLLAMIDADIATKRKELEVLEGARRMVIKYQETGSFV